MITKLTRQQEKQIPIFIDKFLKLAEKPTDRKKNTLAVQALYKSAGEEKPIVIFGKSPFQTAVMVAMCRVLFKDSKLAEDYSQLDSQLRSQLDSQLYKINNDWWLVVWWLVWAGWYAFGQYIGVKFDNKILKIFMDFVTNVSFIIPYKGIAFVSETPTKINWNNGLLHSTSKGAIQYDNGKENYYSIHGVKFTEEQFKKSKKATVSGIIAWEDIDQRSALLREQPIKKLLEKIPKTLVDSTKECGGYKLYEIELKGIRKSKIMTYKSWSSDKQYVKFVPPESKNCLETIAKLRHQTVEQLLSSNKS